MFEFVDFTSIPFFAGIQRLTMWWCRGGLGTAATYIEMQGRETARLRPQCLDWGCPAGQRQSGGSVAVWKYIIHLYKWIILLPVGYLHSHGKSSLLIGTSSINWSFSIAMLNNQRVMILLHPITTYQMIMVIKWLSWLAMYPVDPCGTRMQIPMLPQTLGIWRGPRGPTRFGCFFSHFSFHLSLSLLRCFLLTSTFRNCASEEPVGSGRFQ